MCRVAHVTRAESARKIAGVNTGQPCGDGKASFGHKPSQINPPAENKGDLTRRVETPAAETVTCAMRALACPLTTVCSERNSLFFFFSSSFFLSVIIVIVNAKVNKKSNFKKAHTYTQTLTVPAILMLICILF